MKRLAFAIALLSGPAFAECPKPADISSEMSVLIEAARNASNDIAGRDVAQNMWKLWLRAPDEAAQEVLDQGMRRRDSYDFAGALTEFQRLAEYCPLYAEGFNQSAYIHFLREEYPQALDLLDKALALSPSHVAAQSGRALTLLKLDRIEEARVQLLEALENNPWLSERFLLSEGGPLAPKGQDI